MSSTGSSIAPEENNHSHKGLWVAIVAIVFIVVAAVIGTIAFSAGTGTTMSAPSSSATPTPAPTTKSDDTQAANDQSTVKAPSVLDDWAYPTRYVELTKKYGYVSQTVNKQRFPVFQIGSLGSKTIWPDSVRNPLTTKSPEEIVAHVLAEPDYCAQIAVGLYNAVWFTPTGDAIVVKANNPWLKKWFATDISQVNDWASKAMAGDPQEQLRTAKKCALVAALFEQLTDKGVQTRSTSLNYHIATVDAATVNAANPFGTIRAFELNPYQYKGEFVVVEFQLKGWPSKCENQILINTQDGRFALPQCTPPAPPKCTTNCGTTETSCVVQPGGTKYWDQKLGKYICKDATTNDPSYNGHNLPGGNGQAPAPSPTADPPKADPPPITYTTPPPVAPSAPPVGSTPITVDPGDDQGGGVLN